jgi:ComF family protein
MAAEYKRLASWAERGARRARDRFLQDFLPAECAACGVPLSAELATQGLCATCSSQIHRLQLDSSSHCARCAEPLPCRACQASPWPLRATVAAFHYQYQVRDLLLALKFGARRDIARALAPALAQQLARSTICAALPAADALIAMPLGQHRLAERGFNQSWELLLALNDAWTRLDRPRLPARQWLHRHDTSLQARIHLSSLPREARAQQVRHAFIADKAVAGRCIYLVDDIMTTGATMGAASQALLDQGARDVIALVIARA